MNKVIYKVKTKKKEFAHDDPRSIYDFLRSHGVDHNEAAEAESWCELAGIGDVFEGRTFTMNQASRRTGTVSRIHSKRCRRLLAATLRR